MSYLPFAERCYDKEKQKLANIMAFGKDMEPMKIKQPRPKKQEPDEEIDRFDECKNFSFFFLFFF